MIGYVCKYAPVELLAGFGQEAVPVSSEADNFDCAQNCTHMNMCSHMKALIENVKGKNLRELVLVNCCDSTRRAYDVLKRDMDFIFLMDLPHVQNACSRQHLEDELLRLAEAYRDYSGRSFDYQRFADSFQFEPRHIEGKYIGVLGARVGDQLLAQLRSLVPCQVEDFCCNANRFLDDPPADPKDILTPAEKELPLEAQDTLALKKVLSWYAEELMAQIPCMRMADIQRRKVLVDDPNLLGIIYHTVKFCDFYGFEYEMLRGKTEIPMVKIETDCTLQSMGQLSTRIGGFVESLGMRKEKLMRKDGKYFAGIDSGSTTTNVAVIDRDGNIVDSATVRTGAKAQKGAEKAFAQLKKVNPKDIALVVATGYGRQNISFANDDVTEITCHARGAYQLNPKVRTIIDIGGQDNKAISLDENGNVKNFAMNDKCAAGTGRFLENMAKVLEIDLDQISEIGLHWEEDLNISSMCTVFAESEVVSLIADNKQIPDIVHGLNKSVAAKTMTLVRRARGTGAYMMTGGGARNRGVVGCVEDLVGEPVYVPEDPDLCGALGAALFARDGALGLGAEEADLREA